MPNFRTTRAKIAAKWLTAGEGGLVGYSLDLIIDAFMKRLELGHLARFPQNGPNGQTAPRDALTAMGRDRRVVRGIFDTDEQYAEKQLRWLDDRRFQGQPLMLMQKLHEYVGSNHGVSFRHVDVNGNWFSRAADGTESFLLDQQNWNWDGDASGDRWSRFWVIIYPGTLWTVGAGGWNDAAEKGWNDPAGLVWGTDATIEQVQTLRAIVEDWKAGGTRCVNIILAFDPASFDPASPEPDGTWAHWSKLSSGIRVPSRLDTARYIDGTYQ